MLPKQWQQFRTAAKREGNTAVPVALIVDSPWIPGYFDISHIDYYDDPEVWFRANRRLIEDFPDVIFFPSWWAEWGMALEPSAVGNRIHFHRDQPPGQSRTLFHLEDVEQWAPVNPQTDGLMPFALHRYRTEKQRILDSAHTIPAVAARGPLCVASFLRGVTELMMDFVEDPDGVHRLLRFTTQLVIDWLKEQAEAVGETVDCVFVLDDIPGMISRNFYNEFAAPYLRQIFAAFPNDWVKVYHNDANTKPFLADLANIGIDVLNWSHKMDPAETRAATGENLTLMGNVAPLDLGVRGTPAEVKQAALEVMEKLEGQGLILSMGGGVSPAMPKENLLALCEAAREFNNT